MPFRADTVQEALRILEAAEGGIVLRALGGVAISLRCPSSHRSEFERPYSDIDLIGHGKQTAEIRRLLVDLGYAPAERFNALHGGRRLLFTDDSNKRRIDVFMDVFEMSHRFDLRDRIEIDLQTITLADLLGTKLQVIQTNEKDMGDAICLILDHEIGTTDAGEVINGQYLAKLCGDDWGVYKTFMMKLAMLTLALDKWELSEMEKETVRKRVGRLNDAIEELPKSIGWKMRAAVGERVRWYELPEEDTALLERARP